MGRVCHSSDTGPFSMPGSPLKRETSVEDYSYILVHILLSVMVWCIVSSTGGARDSKFMAKFTHGPVHSENISIQSMTNMLENSRIINRVEYTSCEFAFREKSVSQIPFTTKPLTRFPLVTPTSLHYSPFTNASTPNFLIDEDTCIDFCHNVDSYLLFPTPLSTEDRNHPVGVLCVQ